ncbi:MAG: 6,7-dimethyl-8-ribityllumazine synthase [Candidatus Hodgkinia cicadicola]
MSCCHVYLSDLALKTLTNSLRVSGITYNINWFFGVYELSWLLAHDTVRYCACIVLGFVLKGVSAHNVYIASSVYNRVVRYPVVNAIYTLDYVELAWERAFGLTSAALITSLKTVLGIKCCVML